jgi:hypothetical protein
MIQFDTVVQTNASSAEETASAAEELQSQVGSLNEIVDTLYLLVSGKTYTGRTVAAASRSGVKTGHTGAPAQTEGIHRVQTTVCRTQEETAKQKSSGETGRQISGCRLTVPKKDTAPVPGAKAKDPAGRNDVGHTISFEDDEDFKPV